MTVSDPPSTMARAAASARRATAGAMPSRVSTRTTAWPPRAAMRWAVSTARSSAWPCASAPAASVSDGRGLDRAGLPVGGLLRAHAGEHEAELEALDAGQRGGQAAQRLGLARQRAAGDDHARAAADRRQPLDRLQRRVVGAELQAHRREGARQLVVGRALGDLLGRRAVDGVDAHERRVALRAPRLAHRARRRGRRRRARSGAPGRPRCRRRRRRARAATRARSPSRCPSSSTTPSMRLVAALGGRRSASSASPRVARRRSSRPRPRPPREPRRRLGARRPPRRRPRRRPPRSRRAPSALAVGAVGVAVGVAASASPPESRRMRSIELGLAQPPEAVDAELRGDRVQVGERARLEGVAMQDGHGSSLNMVSVGNPAALRSAAGDPVSDLQASGRTRIHFSSSSPASNAGTSSRPSSTALTARASRTAATSCTRRIAAPASAAHAAAASVPASRSAGGRPVIAPRKYLREIASSSGRPRACRRSSSRSTATVSAGVLAKSGPGSSDELLARPRRGRARASMRSRRKASTSATTSS